MASNSMTHRQRLLAVLERRAPDRLPWYPRLEIWHEANRRGGTLPERYRDIPLREIYRRLDMGIQGRDMAWRRICRTELRQVEVRRTEDGNDVRTEYVTPAGTVSKLERQSEELRKKGIIGLEVEHLIKGPDDYAPVEFIFEHTDIIPTYDEYLQYEADLGEDGLPFPYIGQDPMNAILQELIGYGQAFYHMADHPDRIEHLYQCLCEYHARVQQVTLDSPAKLILHGQHFDMRMTPPRIFARYMVPYFQPFAERLHERGKVLACHADANTGRLMPLVREAGFDVLDCFASAPMVPVTIEEARNIFGEQVIIWGGIPSVLLEDTVSDAEFERYMLSLFKTIAPGRAFILGIADNAMPESSIHRIEYVSRLVAERGAYPLDTNITG